MDVQNWKPSKPIAKIARVSRSAINVHTGRKCCEYRITVYLGDIYLTEYYRDTYRGAMAFAKDFRATGMCPAK